MLMSQNGMMINDVDPATGRYMEKTKASKILSILSVVDTLISPGDFCRHASPCPWLCVRAMAIIRERCCAGALLARAQANSGPVVAGGVAPAVSTARTSVPLDRRQTSADLGKAAPKKSRSFGEPPANYGQQLQFSGDPTSSLFQGMLNS
eukprot:COSAG06_NODE_23806_length_681_cov_0.843643_2_plen_149_part_01